MALVADVVARMKYHDHHDDDNHKQEQRIFNMETWHYQTDCGTAGCLATWAILTEHQGVAKFSTDSSLVTHPDGTITPVEDEAARILDFTPELAAELFNPDICRQAKPNTLTDVYPSEAVQALRNTINTGAPQWSAILCSTDTCNHYCQLCGTDFHTDVATTWVSPDGMELQNTRLHRNLILCAGCHAARLCQQCRTDSQGCGCTQP